MQETKNQVQQTILDAAQARFVKYGFKKTNMTEIAHDTEMSPGNLYRFFAGKEEMGAAVVKRIFSQKRAKCDDVVKEEYSSLENLKLFCGFLLGFYYELYESQEHLTELIDLVFSKQKEILEEQVSTKQAIIQKILESGKENQEFVIDDAQLESGILVNLLNPFIFPSWDLYKKSPIEKLKAELSDSIDLIYRGLKG